nr:uncharacterized protein LOC129271819 [Lytechinus pictus]
MDVTVIDLLNSFPCTSSSMNVSVTLVCDGYYDCDNYEDESFCEYPASYLQPGESYFIYLTHNTTRRRLYNTHFLQTDAINGFQIIFRDLYLYYDEQIRIGKGSDPSDLQSVITTIDGYRYCCPSDVYVESSDMWIAMIGGMDYSLLEVYAEIISTDLSTLYRCSISDKFVSTSALCDGFYHCDHFEDELACRSNVIWIAVVGHKDYNYYDYYDYNYDNSEINVKVTAIDRSNLQECGNTGLSFSNNDRCDEVFTCPDFADEEECSLQLHFYLLRT